MTTADLIAQRDGRLVETYLFAAGVYLALCSGAAAAITRLRRSMPA